MIEIRLNLAIIVGIAAFFFVAFMAIKINCEFKEKGFKEGFKKDFLNFSFSLLTGLLGGIAAFILMSFIMIFVGFTLPKQWYASQEIKLVNLQEVNGIYAKCSLESQFVDDLGSAEYYFYCEKSADGGYIIKRLQLDKNTAIYEEKRSDGILKIYAEKFTKPWMNFFALSLRNKCSFHVPCGSLEKTTYLIKVRV